MGEEVILRCDYCNCRTSKLYRTPDGMMCYDCFSSLERMAEEEYGV